MSETETESDAGCVETLLHVCMYRYTQAKFGLV